VQLAEDACASGVQADALLAGLGGAKRRQERLELARVDLAELGRAGRRALARLAGERRIEIFRIEVAGDSPDMPARAG
jgi:hypothetical protein